MLGGAVELLRRSQIETGRTPSETDARRWQGGVRLVRRYDQRSRNVQLVDKWAGRDLSDLRLAHLGMNIRNLPLAPL